MLNNDIMNLMILSALSLLGVMVAVNAQGKARMAFSWLLATILITGNIIVVGSYLKTRATVQDEETYNQRLVEEKDGLTKSLQNSTDENRSTQEKSIPSGDVQALAMIAHEGEALSESLAAVNLDDYTLSEEQRVSQADAIKQSVLELKSRYDVQKSKNLYFKSKSLIQGLEKLEKSALYCKLYYESADSDQEGVREKVMRTSAVAAKELFQKANQLLVSMK